MIFKKANEIDEGGFPENMPAPEFMKDFKDPLGGDYQDLDQLDNDEYYLYDLKDIKNKEYTLFELRNGNYTFANFFDKANKPPGHSLQNHPNFNKSAHRFKGIGKIVPPAQGREKYLWFSPEAEDYRKESGLNRYFFELRNGEVVESNIWSSDLKYNPEDFDNLIFLGIGKFDTEVIG